MEPCLCGDPSCRHCGDPKAAREQEKINRLIDKILDADLSYDDLLTFVRAGFDAVNKKNKKGVT